MKDEPRTMEMRQERTPRRGKARDILYSCEWCHVDCEDGSFAPFCSPQCQYDSKTKEGRDARRKTRA